MSSSRLVVVLGLICALFAAGTLPAQGQEVPVPDEQVVEIVVFGDVLEPGNIGDTVSRAAVEAARADNYDVPAGYTEGEESLPMDQEIDDNRNGLHVPTQEQLDAGAQEMLAGYGPVAAQWKDSEEKWVRMRDRAVQKAANHNLSIATVRKATKASKRIDTGGTTRRYETLARLYTCGWWNCRLDDSTWIWVPYDVRKYYVDGLAFGVVSAYCKDADRQTECDHWVSSTWGPQ